MKSFLRMFCTVGLGICLSKASAQTCPSGYSTASLNWDNLDFLVQDPTYISASQAQMQYFAFGTNKVTITHNYAGAVTGGENTNNTGEAGSYGTGADVQFIGNGSITITFQTAVQNAKFSVYDIDYNQKVVVTALNGTTAQNVTISRLTTAQLTIAGNGTTSASATGQATTAVADNSSDGTINVDVVGPITSVTITVTQTGTKTNGPKADQEDGSFYISHISACNNTAAFPLAYYAVSKPFINQPGYVLSALDNAVYMINPANGVSKILFTDPSGNNINSIGYDPYNKFLYYTYSLTNAGKVNPNNKAVQKYDVTTGAISTIISNVNTLGIPTYGSGVESGGAAFYDGALYLGIEGIDGDESKIWRIDFDASFNPLVGARQVFAVPTDFHDWSDFAINNGTLYDFDGKASTSSTRYESVYHINLQTGATLAEYNYAQLGFVPRQVAIDWNGDIYNTGAAATTSTGTIVPYTNGAIITTQQFAITEGSTSPAGSWGDAAEAFRPRLDFGDAPASFDPDPLAPAVHDTISTLRLGASTQVEWNRTTNVNTDTDDDGLTYARILNTAAGNYETEVRVYNNTGVSATLAAWIDFNGDGVFQSVEGIVQPVANSTTTQTISLYWSGITSTLPANSFTYLRVRLTTASGLSKTTPTGYFANGEVEDYYVPVNSTILAVKLNNFSAQKTGEENVSVNWSVNEEKRGTNYVLQQSNDGSTWKTVYTTIASNDKSYAAYSYIDAFVQSKQTFYRLQITEPDGSSQYSKIEKIDFGSGKIVKIYPNPTSGNATITVNATSNDIAKITLVDIAGEPVFAKSVPLQKGKNSFVLPVASHLPEGVYTVQVVFAGELYIQKLLISKNQ